MSNIHITKNNSQVHFNKSEDSSKYSQVKKIGQERHPAVSKNLTGWKTGLSQGTRAYAKINVGSERMIANKTSTQSKGQFNDIKKQISHNATTHTSAKSLGARSISDGKLDKKNSESKIKGFFESIKQYKNQKNKAKIDKAFEKHGYSQNEILQPKSILQGNLQGKLKAFGSGQLNTAYLAKFKDENGLEKEMIVKFETQYKSNHDIPVQLKSLGVDISNTKETARNMAAQALDDILGWGCIVKTQVGVLKNPNTNEYGVVTAMEKAKGTPGVGKPITRELSASEMQRYKNALASKEQDIIDMVAESIGFKSSEAKLNEVNGQLQSVLIKDTKFTDLDLHDPLLKKGLVKLQLQDAIMMNVDRHLGNYFIETQPGTEGKDKVVAVRGIDNDQLGGTVLEIEASKSGTTSMAYLPTQIPSDVCKDILNIDSSVFAKQMSCCLPKIEVEAALKRLDTVKSHVTNVLANNQKNGEDSTIGPMKSENSYWMSFLAKHDMDAFEKLTH